MCFTCFPQARTWALGCDRAWLCLWLFSGAHEKNINVTETETLTVPLNIFPNIRAGRANMSQCERCWEASATLWLRNCHVELWATQILWIMAYVSSRKCWITPPGLRDEALGQSSCGRGVRALVLRTLEVRVLFVVLSWAYLVALDKAHYLHSHGILDVMKVSIKHLRDFLQDELGDKLWHEWPNPISSSFSQALKISRMQSILSLISSQWNLESSAWVPCREPSWVPDS